MILFRIFQFLRELVYMSKFSGKKYILTDTKKTLENGKTVYCIKAIKDFGHIRKGQIGGWIESEDNLSHDGECWVDDEAVIYGNAYVSGNASVQDDAIVYGNACINDNVLILGNAEIYGDALITGHTRITGFAKVYEKAKVGGAAFITGSAEIHGNAILIGEIKISGISDIYGSTVITGNPIIREDAKIKSCKDVLVITIAYDDTHTFFRCGNGEIYVICNSYDGNLNGFICYINQILYEDKSKLYLNMLRFVETYFDIKRKF